MALRFRHVEVYFQVGIHIITSMQSKINQKVTKMRSAVDEIPATTSAVLKVPYGQQEENELHGVVLMGGKRSL